MIGVINMKKITIFILFSLILSGCSNYQNDYLSVSLNNVDYESSEDNYFENLEIRNTTVKKDEVSDWYRIMGEIKNNNDVTVDGYIEVVLYDEYGGIVDSALIDLPIGGIKPGEIAVFSKTITKSEFHSYKFYDSILMAR